MKFTRGFTLIELLVTIAIIGVLSSIVISSLSVAKQRGPDVSDIAQLRQIQTQLDIHYDQYRTYPSSDYDGCGGWDIGNRNYTYISNLTGFNTPEYYKFTDTCNGYAYYKYNAGDNGCPSYLGAYYLIGIKDSSRSALANSPGFGLKEGCSRNWNTEFIWVTGKFENA